jgi:hypothetical protein
VRRKSVNRRINLINSFSSFQDAYLQKHIEVGEEEGWPGIEPGLKVLIRRSSATYQAKKALQCSPEVGISHPPPPEDRIQRLQYPGRE